jgi:hypothetical protein
MKLAKRHAIAISITALGLPLFLAFQNAGSLRTNTVPIGHLYTYRGTSSCPVRPSTYGAPYYNAIVASRSAGAGLTNGQVIDHAASRLGYGLSPLGYVVPAYSGDCSTVYLAEEVALQVDAMSLMPDPAHVTQIRSVLMPFSFYTRADLARKLTAFQNDPANAQFNPTPHGQMWWNMRIEIGLIKTLRALYSSQFNDATHGLQDKQVNLRERIGEIWSNMYNIDASKTDQYNSASNGLDPVMRAHYGNTFYSLLSAVTFHPQMLLYLDNADNRAICASATSCVASNQNLARELLELHSIGIGPRSTLVNSPYTQTDIEQMGLALAGWNVNKYTYATAPGDTVYNSALAAPIAVTIMGKSYPAGQTRMSLILKDLANHATTKNSVCKRLASNLFGPAAHVTKATSACVAAWGVDGQLIAMYGAMLKLPEFWSIGNYKSLYRNPIDLPIAYARGFGQNMIDMYNKAISRGINHTHFKPDATLTRDRLNTLLTSRSTDSGWWTLNGVGAQMKMLIGAPRNEIAFPVGYEEIGAKNLSPGYIDQASRASLEMAIYVEGMTQATRTDMISKKWDDWVKSLGPNSSLATASQIKNGYYTSVLMQGAIANRMSASHKAIVDSMLFNQNKWPYWQNPADASQRYTGPAKMMAGMNFACAEGLRK